MEPTYFAAVGDVHGEVNRMHDLLMQWCQKSGQSFSFVLQVGDFEPHRHEEDLDTMAAPAKYRALGDFPKYHQELRFFPWPTYFIGGNHEPYGYLDSMPQGGELVNNLWYLGRVGTATVGTMKVGGLSGIFLEKFYEKRPPITEIETISNKSYIGFLEEEVAQALDWGNVDILLLHDWPAGIIAPADEARFLGKRRVIDPKYIGNEPARMLVDLLQPKLVLCGHMHMAYRNRITQDNGQASEIHCLASVHQGWDALAVFKIDEEGTFTRIT